MRGLLLSLAALVPLASATAAEPPATPAIAELGGDRFRIGRILVDKRAGRFSVPGKVLRTEPPLEFLAVSRNGRKGYEAMFELDVTAFEFNLACILIGLEEPRSGHPEYHFDERPVEGDEVRLELTWEEGEVTYRQDAGELILEGRRVAVPSRWVYTGSIMLEDGTYYAHQQGTLVGLVHDPASVIEHRAGLGLGNYGEVSGNTDLAPPADAAVTLIVTRVPGPAAAGDDTAESP